MLQLTTYRLSPQVSAFSTTRQGGVSKDNYASLNINPYCGDTPTAVEQNRRLLCQELSLDENRLVLPHQTHGTTVRQIGEEFFSLSPSVRQMVLDGVDALITDLPEVCIGVSTADCIPILLYDSIHRSMAAVHAGWRGTAKRILQKTVEEMGRAYQTRPETLRAVIGPGISLTHFEVGDEVYQAFAQAGFAMEQIARRQEKWHLDLPLCNQLQLQELGLELANIQNTAICTYANYHEYFSARRLGTASGRIFTGIKLHQT